VTDLPLLTDLELAQYRAARSETEQYMDVEEKAFRDSLVIMLVLTGASAVLPNGYVMNGLAILMPLYLMLTVYKASAHLARTGRFVGRMEKRVLAEDPARLEQLWEHGKLYDKPTQEITTELVVAGSLRGAVILGLFLINAHWSSARAGVPWWASGLVLLAAGLIAKRIHRLGQMARSQ
jgi:hypothetical protein